MTMSLVFTPVPNLIWNCFSASFTETGMSFLPMQIGHHLFASREIDLAVLDIAPGYGAGGCMRTSP